MILNKIDQELIEKMANMISFVDPLIILKILPAHTMYKIIKDISIFLKKITVVYVALKPKDVEF